MQAFGPEERGPNEKEYEKIKHMMKVSPRIPLKYVEQVANAEYECNYFRRLSMVVGGLCVPLFFKFPIVRSMPGLKRIGFSLLGASIPYFHLNYMADAMEERRVLFLYRKWIVANNAHPNVFVG